MTERIFDDLISDKEWLIEENGWQRAYQRVREAHFTLGNCVIGSRGVLEELPYGANSGTFVAGVFDGFGAQIPELVNLPNPIVLRVDVSGEKVDPAAMDVLDHYRVLDMKKGLLARHTTYETALKKKIDYQSYRFISQHQKFLGVMVVSITALDAPMTFNVNSMIDTSVCNSGVLSEGRKRHFEVTNVSKSRIGNYTEICTFEHQHVVGYASCLEVKVGGKKHSECHRIFKIKLKKGETVTFTKYFTIVPSFYVKGDNIKKVATDELRRAKGLGIGRLLQASEEKWNQLWNLSDIKIGASLLTQKAIRFNIYHLLIAGNDDSRVSVGARTLSGEGYRGHIFWDAETFIFPFFLFTNPKVAKSMLLYRWSHLDQARKIAAIKGYKGALFPWESADTGEETTPPWLKDLVGEVLKIETLEEEHHINADIAYAVNQYYEATGDEHFIVNHGLEILIETARFWSSRLKYNKGKSRYELHKIMGPDEFHRTVKNNVYTAKMARFNLLIAVKWARWIKKHDKVKYRKLSKKWGIADKEVAGWKRIADKIYVSYSKSKKIYEQHDRYLKLPDPQIRELDRHFMPVVPMEACPVEEGKTQLIKQADVVMLLYMLYDDFSLEEIERNYKYYEPRTLHKSSLSPAIHSIIATRIGSTDRALHYLYVALKSDLQDIHGNAEEGFHAASGGGVWQALVMGFGGMDLGDDKLSFSPLLPMIWKSLKFKVVWRGAILDVTVSLKCIEIERLTVGKRKKMHVYIYGHRRELPLKKPINVCCYTGE